MIVAARFLFILILSLPFHLVAQESSIASINSKYSDSFQIEKAVGVDSGILLVGFVRQSGNLNFYAAISSIDGEIKSERVWGGDKSFDRLVDAIELTDGRIALLANSYEKSNQLSVIVIDENLDVLQKRSVKEFGIQMGLCITDSHKKNVVNVACDFRRNAKTSYIALIELDLETGQSSILHLDYDNPTETQVPVTRIDSMFLENSKGDMRKQVSSIGRSGESIIFSGMENTDNFGDYWIAGVKNNEIYTEAVFYKPKDPGVDQLIKSFSSEDGTITSVGLHYNKKKNYELDSKWYINQDVEVLRIKDGEIIETALFDTLDEQPIDAILHKDGILIGGIRSKAVDLIKSDEDATGTEVFYLLVDDKLSGTETSTKAKLFSELVSLLSLTNKYYALIKTESGYGIEAVTFD